MTDAPGIVEDGQSALRKAAPMERSYVHATKGFLLVHAFGRLISPADVVCGNRITEEWPGNEPLDLHCRHCQSRVRTLFPPGPDKLDEPLMVVDHDVSCPWLAACARSPGAPPLPYHCQSTIIQPS
jgi:hypothetical protein